MPNKARSKNEAVKRTNGSVQTRGSRKANAQGSTTQTRRSSTTMSSSRSRKSASRPGTSRDTSATRSRALEPDPVTKASQQAIQTVSAFFSKAKPTNSSAKREDRRRARNKYRADKMFAKSYGDSSSAGSSSEQAEGAPRAALYKGEMGKSQRKSSRMQKASKAGSPNVKFDPRGWFSSLRLKGFPVKTVTAVLCVVLAFVFLYTPAQQYYQSMRERDRLAAEYAAIEQRNDALQSQNMALASDAGMEDAVRQKYGYVKPGEQSAKVSGLSDATTDPTRDSAGIEASVLSSSVKAPEEWYTPYLDAFFGVK